MAPDLHIDPDAVVRLAAAARRVVDGLAAQPAAPGPGAEMRPVSGAASELLAFAAAAELAVRRVREADDAVARDVRDLDGVVGRAPG